ncbi:zinc-dependent metalloprotease [Marinifilum sp. RC60d5]|uniref:zinc-dependent metalloprotease n=1 Tax=Marinifilum sp. RC60d5 TaxID=3458414 RepID=UPI00403669AA
MFRFKLSTIFIILVLSFSVSAQTNNEALAKKYQALVNKADLSDNGFISLHKSDSKLWLEIPDSIMRRDLLIGSRIEETSSTKSAVAGQMMHNPMMVRFSHDNKTVFMHLMNNPVSVDKNDSIAISFARNNKQTVMHAFKIEAVNAKNNACVIDVTKFFNSQITQISPFGGGSLGKAIPETTKTIDARAYSRNVEIVTQMGFYGKRKQFMCSMHRSIVLLPKKPMRPRLSSKQIGYYDEVKKELSSNYMNSKSYGYIKRWRIEAKKEDIKRHKNGQLVEPKKPIIYYLDNSIPEKWKPYIKAGIEDWQKAFEKIGFKNAIIAKDYPLNDTSFHANDFTNNCFRYITTEKANAMGNAWIDPRSGEIIQGDVLFYHNVISKLYQWRFAQTAACDPAIRGDINNVDEKILGDLIRYATAHEIGHCLGMKHNYRASYSFPVDSLRSASFTQKYGTTASIMDYARNNYIAQPKDKGVKLTPPLLGIFDYFSIKWAYQPIYEANTPEEETATLNKWFQERSEDDMYLFGTKNGMGDGTLDPSVLTESLGNDLVKASRYGAANIKIIMHNLIDWTDADKYGAAYLKEMYTVVVKQYNQYFKHVEALLGGVYEYNICNETHPEKFVAVPRDKQKEALKFAMEELLSQYDWLNQNDFIQRMGSLDREIMKAQGKTIGSLVNRNVLVRMSTCSSQSSDPYTVGEYLGDITHYLFNVSDKKQNTKWLRNLQIEYVKVLHEMLKDNAKDKGHVFNNIIMADIYSEIFSISKIALKQKMEKTPDDVSYKHFSFLLHIVE